MATSLHNAKFSIHTDILQRQIRLRIYQYSPSKRIINHIIPVLFSPILGQQARRSSVSGLEDLRKSSQVSSYIQPQSV